MPLTTEQEQLLANSEVSVLVFGRGADFILVRCLDYDSKGEDEDWQSIVNRRLDFLGVLGFRDGAALAKLNPTLDAVVTVSFACNTFAQMCAEHMRSKLYMRETGGGTGWLDRLYRLDS